MVRLYINEDHTTEVVQRFEEKGEKTGRRSLVEDNHKHALELGMDFTLSTRTRCRDEH